MLDEVKPEIASTFLQQGGPGSEAFRILRVRLIQKGNEKGNREEKMIRFLFAAGVMAAALAGCQSAKGAGEPSANAIETANKEKALYCMDLLFNKHDIDASRTECFGDTYIQHNPLAPDGPEAVLGFMSGFFESHPDAAIEIKRVAADGDLVWIHYNNKLTPDSRGLAVVDIFRMEDGRFVEHWDVAQPVPEKSANDNTMF